jgi:hypothetical protein
MSRWHGYVYPLIVIALSTFVGWCAWPPPRVAATTGDDGQARAAQYVRAGDTLLVKGKVDEAAVEYHRANLASPNHPQARAGRARVAAARGHYYQALDLYRSLMAEAPTPEVAKAIDDILALTRRSPGAPVRGVDNGTRTRGHAPSQATRAVP